MALDRKNLAFSQLAATKSDIYGQGVTATGLVHNITIHNANTSAEDVLLYYNDGSNEYLIFNFSVDPDETVLLDFRGEGFIVDPVSGAKITGNADTAAFVTIKIDGTEES